MHSISRVFLIIAALIVHVSNTSLAQSDIIQKEAIFLQKALEKNHYSPRIFDDSLSKEIFMNFISSLDKYQLYFTADDYKKLSTFQFSLDDELKGQGWKFLPMVTAIYKDRLIAAATICKKQSDKPFDFAVDESFISASAELNFARDESEISQRWSKRLKYQALWEVVYNLEKNGTSEVNEKHLKAKEAEIRNKILKVELRKINKILDHPQGYENQLKTKYFNAITACFDPHTTYFSKTELQNFESRLSIEGLSFGLDLEENETGDIEIVRLVPGGPAWKSNELHKGDVLLKLKWLNKEEFDLTGADLSEVEDILEASNALLIEFTIRNSEGTIKKVSLKKEKLRGEENIVKSFIINGENKIGYISLPGFYTEWNNENGHGCANDVAKEIVKLKKEKIDGIILDLRYNGGGSLQEGLNLTGIFIDEGPLFVIQEKEGKERIIKDINRGTVYDGPLIVMVNGQSASASELLASTLQDYNRAIIVGSPTFGKATGQRILPLDPNLMAVSNNKSPYGHVKITIEKIFRITGQTAQLSGVTPDIYLPDVFETYGYREEILPKALPNGFINKRIVYNKLPSFPDSMLQVNSKNRLLEHEGFNKIVELQKKSSSNSIQDLKEIPLNISFFQMLNNDHKLWNSFLDYTLKSEIKTYTVENPPFNSSVTDVDIYSREISKDIINNLQADMYIEESYFVLSDLIKHHKKK